MDSQATSGQERPWQPAPGSRQADVLSAVSERGAIRVTDLAEELNVTPVTVRRDVASLADAGLVRRVHGGATTIDRSIRSGGDGVPGSARLQGAVGALVPSLDFYWPDVVRGAEQEGARIGMRLLLRGSVYYAADERGDIDRLVEAGVSGLLLAPTVTGPGGARLREWLTDPPVPVVVMERAVSVGPSQRPVESVRTDHAGGAAMAVHHLASLGHTRIGVVLNANSPHVEQIRLGWHSACAEIGLSIDGVTDIALPDRRDSDYERTIDSAADSAAATSTTALIVHSDPEAMRVLQNAQEKGWNVPGGLSIISYDDQVATLSTPALSAIRPPRRTIGKTAVGLLAARIADPDRPVHRVQVSPTLFVRGSSGPPGR